MRNYTSFVFRLFYDLLNKCLVTLESSLCNLLLCNYPLIPNRMAKKVILYEPIPCSLCENLQQN